MAINTDLRPPYPNMGDDELHQFQERLYKAILALEASVTPTPTPTPTVTDHNDLTNNGGDNSHTSITAHINSDIAHGASSELMGINDEQVVINKEIDADNNTISNLKHGEEVDNPAIAHGVASEILGVSDEQTIINKVIDANDNAISNLEHGVEVDNPTSAHGVMGDILGTTDAQTITNKRIIKNFIPVLESPFLVLAGSDHLSCQVEGIISLPDDALVGETLTIENSSTGYITVSSALLRIEGEVAQRVPPNSSMTIFRNELEWRIV